MPGLRCVTLLAALTLLLPGADAQAQQRPSTQGRHRAAATKRTPQRTRLTSQEVCTKPVLELPADSVLTPPLPGTVYTYLEHMPLLAGQSGGAASWQFIQQHLVVPPGAPPGRVFVQLDVDTTGVARQPRILRGLRPDVDSAVVAAARQLPRFTPGSQAGRPGVVRLVVPVRVP